ncbi:MAG: hypothetical protein LDLANPLL_00607 [Turneriella sp.]|nr:hypothetical protein [Turneriella sp.]
MLHLWKKTIADQNSVEEIFSYAKIWKERILNRTLWVVAVAAILTSITRFFRIGSFDFGVAIVIILAIVALLHTLPVFSWKIKALFLILSFTGIGLYFLPVTGPRYGPLCIMGAACLITEIFIGRWITYALTFFGTIIILCFAILVHLGLLQTRDVTPTGEAPWIAWIQAAILFLAVNSLLVNLIRRLVSSLETSFERLKRQHAISHNLSLYDSLTGLPNRKLFYDRLEHAILASDRTLEYGALFLIDVDNLKNINDISGHVSGDYYLTVVAERISSIVKDTDTVARWGGDEFVVIVENLSPSLSQAGREAERLGEKILEALSQPVTNPDKKTHTFQNTASIGITLMYGRIHTAEELVKRADIAMYKAKSDGKNRLRNFDMQMQRKVEERITLEANLKQALHKNEFKLLFQPQYDLRNTIIGAEILLRWNHPTRKAIYPNEFIPLAEETGEIIEIGKWILHMACIRLQEWAEKPETQNLTLAINVSPRQFRDPGFVGMVSDIVRNSRIRPQNLKLELTESLMLENIDETITRMEDLKEIGVTFSLDDFGTGYSSLSYLKKLPFSQIKIDQSFIRDLTKDYNDAVLIRTIIGMAQNLNLHVVAEGVEVHEQLTALREMGCHAYQGYYFSRPIPIEEFEKLVFR